MMDECYIQVSMSVVTVEDSEGRRHKMPRKGESPYFESWHDKPIVIVGFYLGNELIKFQCPIKVSPGNLIDLGMVWCLGGMEIRVNGTRVRNGTIVRFENGGISENEG